MEDYKAQDVKTKKNGKSKEIDIQVTEAPQRDVGASASPPRSSRKKEKGHNKRLPKGLACLRHRHMHKRCPPECPERRAMQNQLDAAGGSPPDSPVVEFKIREARPKRVKSKKPLSRSSDASTSDSGSEDSDSEEYESDDNNSDINNSNNSNGLYATHSNERSTSPVMSSHAVLVRRNSFSGVQQRDNGNNNIIGGADPSAAPASPRKRKLLNNLRMLTVSKSLPISINAQLNGQGGNNNITQHTNNHPQNNYNNHNGHNSHNNHNGHNFSNYPHQQIQMPPQQQLYNHHVHHRLGGAGAGAGLSSSAPELYGFHHFQAPGWSNFGAGANEWEEDSMGSLVSASSSLDDIGDFSDLISCSSWENSKKSSAVDSLMMDVVDNARAASPHPLSRTVSGDNENNYTNDSNNSNNYNNSNNATHHQNSGVSVDQDSDPTNLLDQSPPNGNDVVGISSEVLWQQKEMVSRVVITRDFVVKCLPSPQFHRLLCGFFVRICVDANVFKVAQIVNVLENYYTKYEVDAGVVTDRALLLAIGNTTKIFSIVDVSEMKPLEHEIDEWLHEALAAAAVNSATQPLAQPAGIVLPLSAVMVQEKLNILDAVNVHYITQQQQQLLLQQQQQQQQQQQARGLQKAKRVPSFSKTATHNTATSGSNNSSDMTYNNINMNGANNGFVPSVLSHSISINDHHHTSASSSSSTSANENDSIKIGYSSFDASHYGDIYSHA